MAKSFSFRAALHKAISMSYEKTTEEYSGCEVAWLRDAADNWLAKADGVNVEHARKQRPDGLPRVNGPRGKRPMTSRRHLPSELVIGVVGPYDLVERIMLSGAAARDEAFGAIPSTSPPGQRRTAETGSGETGGIGLAGRSGGSGGSGVPGGPGERGVALSSPGPAPPREEPEGLIGSALPRRLIAAAYRREREAPEKVARLGAGIDVCLFASPVPYEYARRAGMVAVPGTYVRLDGGALYAALLRASRDRGYDIERISVDVLSRAAVEEAYAELGIVADSVRLR